MAITILSMSSLFVLGITITLMILCSRLNSEGTAKELRRTILCRYSILYLMYICLYVLVVLTFTRSSIF